MPQGDCLRIAEECPLCHAIVVLGRKNAAMADNIFSIDIDEVRKIVDTHFANQMKSELIQGVLSIVHKITSYQEEDKTFSFKIAVGTEKCESMAAPCFYPIKKIPISSEDLENAVKKAIKNVAVFCAKDGDLYLYQQKDEIICGVYFTDLVETGKIEERMLDNDVVIFESVREGLLALKIKNTVYGLNLTLDKGIDKINVPETYIGEECCYWDGIFRHIKSSIHGTILLVVKPEWKATDDDSFMSTPEEINGINISYDSKNKNENCRELFFSMLDYDGITIIDTKGQVRSYHNFCKSKIDADVSGGARHRAFESLKKCTNPNYKAIYFQSQEGKIEYYDFEGREGHRSRPFFDSKIMCLGADNPCLRDVEKYIGNRNMDLTFDKLNFTAYLKLDAITWNCMNLVKQLRTAHFDFDNFAREKEPSKKLKIFFTANKVHLNENLLQFPSFAKYFINTLILCFVGNNYGYSFEGRPFIADIIKDISLDVLKVYFEKQDYISENVLHELSYSYDGHEREWRDFTVIASQEDVDFRMSIYECFENFFWLWRGYIHLDVKETDEIEIPKPDELNSGEKLAIKLDSV